MINAHTTTRTFRELQFDIKAFLYALYALLPIDGQEDKGLVEIKWADGSVDIVPTFELVKGICNSTYMKLIIGGVAELIPNITSVPIQNGKYYKEVLNLIIQSAPLKAHMEEIGSASEDLEFIRGTIYRLVADTVELPSNAVISTMTVDGKLYTTTCNVGTEVRALTLDCGEGFSSGYAGSGGSKFQVDLSSIRVTTPIQVYSPYTQSFDLSVYTVGSYTRVPSRCLVTGYFRVSTTDSDTIKFESESKGIFVDIPVYGSSNSIDYVRSGITTINKGLTTPLPLNSPPSIATLYPLKSMSLLDGGDMLVTLGVPTDTDNNSIVMVENPTSAALRLCNAWAFGVTRPATVSQWLSQVTDMPLVGNIANGVWNTVQGVLDDWLPAVDGDNLIGGIESLNTIIIPPYSAIDFLFTWEIKGGSLCVYMLPMTSRDLKGEG